MHYSISNNAEYGDYTRGSRIIDDSVKSKMKEALKQIQDGSYAKEFMSEMSVNGSKRFKELREESKGHLIEKIGSEIRSSFTWGNKDKLIDKTKN